MTVLIVVDFDYTRPELDGRWHRVAANRVPQPGEPLTTLCGRTEPVAYGSVAERTPALRACAECDRKFRLAQGIPVWPGASKVS